MGETDLIPGLKSLVNLALFCQNHGYSANDCMNNLYYRCAILGTSQGAAASPVQTLERCENCSVRFQSLRFFGLPR
jgi:hypothetical protein